MILDELQIRNLISGLLVEGFKDDQNFLSEKYPHISRQLMSLKPKQIRWLTIRFGQKPQQGIEEIHPIEDCISTLLTYSREESGIKMKYSENPKFRALVDKKFPQSERDWLNPADSDYMTIDQMENLMSLSKDAKQNVKVDNIDITSAIVGKAGPWTVYMPDTKEESCKIVGTNPETRNPNTIWCTVRTSGSNLFYNYVANNVILFYVIRDNPASPDDYICLGYRQGTLVADGQDGGVTVDGNNRGLKQEDIQHILGSHYSRIIDIIDNKNKKLQGKHPQSALMEKAYYDLESFQKLFGGLSKNEKLDMLVLLFEKDYDDNIITKQIAVEMSNILLHVSANKHPNPNLSYIAGNVPAVVINQMVSRIVSVNADLDNVHDTLDFLVYGCNETLTIENWKNLLSLTNKKAISHIMDNWIPPPEIIEYVARKLHTDNGDDVNLDLVISNMNGLCKLLDQSLVTNDAARDILAYMAMNDAKSSKDKTTNWDTHHWNNGLMYLTTNVKHRLDLEDDLFNLIWDSCLNVSKRFRWIIQTAARSSKLSKQCIDKILYNVIEQADYGIPSDFIDLLGSGNIRMSHHSRTLIMQNNEFWKLFLNDSTIDRQLDNRHILENLYKCQGFSKQILDILCDRIDINDDESYGSSSGSKLVTILLMSRHNIDVMGRKRIITWIKCDNKKIRRACAMCEYLDDDMYLKLADDESHEVLRELLENNKISDNVLLKLSNNIEHSHIANIAKQRLRERRTHKESVDQKKKRQAAEISENLLHRLIRHYI